MKEIKMSAKEILQLIRKEEVILVVREVYFDEDAEDYLPNGTEEMIEVRYED